MNLAYLEYWLVNLAAGLAQDGHRTLLVDVDPQAHATFWFAEDPDEIDYDLQDVITKGTPPDQVILRTRIDNLDLIPSTLGLAPLETELVSMTRREDRIDRALTAQQLPDGLSGSDVVRSALSRLTHDVTGGLDLIANLTDQAHTDAAIFSGRRNRGLPPRIDISA